MQWSDKQVCHCRSQRFIRAWMHCPRKQGRRQNIRNFSETAAPAAGYKMFLKTETPDKRLAKLDYRRV